MTATREVSPGHGQGSLPIYQLHYAVYYNSSSAAAHADAGVTGVQTSTVVPDVGAAAGGEQKASNVCARHYAETFLIRLFDLESWLNELCSARRRPAFSPRVIIHTVVVVRVYAALVSQRCAG